MALAYATARRSTEASRRVARAARSLATTPGGEVSRQLAALVAQGTLVDDGDQRKAAAALDAVLGGLDGGGGGVQGAYLHGPVGTGKTVLLDMFFRKAALPPAPATSPVAATPPTQRGKRRDHFHAFMQDLHLRLHEIHETRPRRIATTPEGMRIHRFGGPSHGLAGGGDADGSGDVESATPPHPVDAAAEALARDVALLALDEVQVHDVADALILHRLFDSLWKAGVSTVFTSNAAPSQLYERGISYGYFLPFVVGLHERCSVVKVGSATTEGKPLDYRRTLDAAGRLDGGVPKTQSAYFAGPNARALLDTAWKDAMKKLALTEDASPSALPVAFGRTLRISRGASGKIARFSFQELCGWRKGDALSAGDYMELVQAHEAIYVANVPLLTNKKRDAAARFVRLVDCAYDQGTALVVAAAGSPDDLFAALLDTEKYDDDEEETPVTEEERSSFRRAASRLVELGRATRRK